MHLRNNIVNSSGYDVHFAKQVKIDNGNPGTKQIARLGGEEKVVTLFGNVFNALQNAIRIKLEDITTLILNSYGGVLQQISP